MGDIKKKHHFVPVSLLAGFTKKGTKDSMLWVFDQQTGGQWDTKPKAIGFEKHLYNVEVPGMEVDGLEDTFMDIETKAAPIIERIKDKQKVPDGDDFDILMYYIALQFSRTPKRKEAVSEPMRDIAKTIMQMSVSTKERYENLISELNEQGKQVNEQLPYEEMYDFVMNEDRYQIGVDNTTKMRNMLTSVHAIYPTLKDRRWSVLYCPPTRGDFICSDNPVSLHWITKQRTAGIFNSPGHALENTEVSIPLSSRIMLVGRFDDFQPLSGVVPNKHTLATLNSFTGIESNRFIYSRKNDFYWITKEQKLANIEDFKKLIYSNI